MDRELREITRRLATGEMAAAGDFISHSYRMGHRPQRTFDELSGYIDVDDAEIALMAYHNAIRDDLFRTLKTRNSKAVAELTKIFSERGWFVTKIPGLRPLDRPRVSKTELWEGYPEVNYDIRIKGVCDKCSGTGIPLICNMCDAEYPCPHFNTTSPLGNKVVISPIRAHSYLDVVFVKCPYCGGEHSHKYADIDTPYRMTPRMSDCYPGGEYEIQFTPNCSCEKNMGTVVTRTFYVFQEAFYRHVWANLQPPGIEIDTIVSGKNYCNVLLEDEPRLKHATLHGWVSVKDKPHDRGLTMRVPLARLDLEGTADLVYWDLIRAHNGWPRQGMMHEPED